METENNEKVKISLGGMTCANCALKIETKLKKLDGVSSSVVNFANEEATVEFNSSLTGYDDFNKAIRDLGYKASLAKIDVRVIDELSEKEFSKLIPEVRMNISGSLANAKNKQEIAGIDGRITIVNGFPHKCGEIKFGASDHTARLILSAKEFENSINFVINLKFKQEWIRLISSHTDLQLQEIIREEQPEEVKNQEFSTMQWLIKNSVEKHGTIPDIIWDAGSIGKEPIIRLFGRNSKEMIVKLNKIISAI